MDLKLLSKPVLLYLFLISLFISSGAFASHIQGGSISYKSLGSNKYEITLTLYRDCSGSAAPDPFATVEIISTSCNISTHIDLMMVPGTGSEISPICPGILTRCSDPTSTFRGVQEYVYRGVKELPACSDWVLSYSLCCRSLAVSTIVSPGNIDMYIETRFDNLNFPDNSSPKFTNQSAPFICVGQPYNFNNGSFDIDGDSLTYELISPKISGLADVTFNVGYSVSQPFSSSPAGVFNSTSGDLFVTPNKLQVAEFAVLVKQWHNGSLIGSVIRDVMVRAVACSNNDPYLNGIFNTGSYKMNAVVGQPLSFSIPTFDMDANQDLSVSWNSAIPGATIVLDSSTSASRPTIVFTWTPAITDANAIAHCFTVTVKDNNCPYQGSQTYPFCIKVGTTSSFSTQITSKKDLKCNNVCIGEALVSVSGGGQPPFHYNWSDGVGNTSSVKDLCAGTYVVAVSDSLGSTSYSSVTINEPLPILLNIQTNNTSSCQLCDGQVSIAPTGAIQPYSIRWSDGSSGTSLSKLCSGKYTATVTDSNSCSSSESITVVSTGATTSNFAMLPDSLDAFKFYGFNSSYGKGATYSWDFGDQNFSNLEKPTHTYATTGSYEVCLTTSSALCGSDTLCKTINVNGALKNCLAYFNIADDTAVSDPNNFVVYNLSYGSNLLYLWKFGDATTADLMSPSHVYADKKNYYLCLSVYNNEGCEDTFCDSIKYIDSKGLFNSPIKINIHEVLLGMKKIVQDDDGFASAFPNPFHDITTIDINSKNLNNSYSFELVDVLGRTIKSVQGIKQKQFQVNRNGIEDGIYFYKIIDSEKTVFTGKIVIK